MVFDILGLVGVLFYISSYGLLQLGVIRGSGYVYASMNIVAATLTLISLMNAFNLWSAISQLFFMTFSGIGMIRIWMASRSIKFTEEEKRLIADRLGAFSILDARRFFDAGQWIDAKPGQNLTDQGQVVDGLYYVMNGSVRILVNDKEIAVSGGDTFIGEMSCLAGTPASATARVSAPCRLFFIKRDKLLRIVQKNPVLNEKIRLIFFEEIADKLRENNSSLAN